ncbi:MAG: lipid-A-disaccharide synthase [bacterium]|nr:lipid-A-disaccharide synthase [bacterium]
MSIRTRKILILAGEESGDLHGSYLIDALLKLSLPLQIFAMGGEKMRLAGAKLIENTLDSSVVGITEVIRKIPDLLQRKQRIEDFVNKEQPDLVIFIDFPGFHLKIMPILSDKTSLVYYIPPKVWVWKQNRARKILQFCKRVYTIFPFENTYFEGKASYFGHPLVDFVKASCSTLEFKEEFGLNKDVATIALVPGSRQQEIVKMLPRFCETARLVSKKHEVQWLLPLADSIDDRDFPEGMLSDLNVQIIRGRTYDVIKHCDFMLATSGTVTLEAALLGTPMIICNRASWVTYLAFKIVSKVPYLGLPNIISKREICPEMLQSDTQPDRLAQLTLNYLQQPQKLGDQRKALNEVVQTLGEPGVLKRVSNHMAEEFLT